MTSQGLSQENMNEVSFHRHETIYSMSTVPTVLHPIL